MLENFIESNGLKARVVQGIPTAGLIRCRLFVLGNDEILAVALRESRLSFDKIRGLLGGKPEPVSEGKAEQMTGYMKEFLPPISIYGAKVMLDKGVMEKSIVRCLVGKDRFLEISPGEIKDFNDDVAVVDITE